MRFFSKLGELFINLFTLIGTLIFELIELPRRIRSKDFRKKIDITRFMEQWRKIPAHLDKLERKISDVKASVEDNATIMKSIHFEASEKENTILKLQLSATAFLITSILYSFNIISIIIFGIVGVPLIFTICYILYYQVKVMYPEDFNAYRDFFIMYIMVGILLIMVANNPAFSTSFFFTFFPSLSILLFAMIAVLAVFLIFRIRYYREYTFGKVIETGKNTSYVRVDYDIRSNVKPDIYIVENNGFKVKKDDIVKLAIEDSLFSVKGNRPTKIIGIVKQ